MAFSKISHSLPGVDSFVSWSGKHLHLLLEPGQVILPEVWIILV